MKLLVTLACVAIGWNVAHASGQQGPGDSWSLSTDDTTIVVAVQQGIPVVTRLSSGNAAWNWVLAPSPEILLPTVTQKGSAIATKWRYDGGAYDSGTGRLVLRFSNPAPSLELQSIWQARPGRGPIEHWLTIANNSAMPITLGHQDSLILSHLVVPMNEEMDAWWIKRGASNATTELSLIHI